MMIPSDLEAGVKGQIRHCKTFTGLFRATNKEDTSNLLNSENFKIDIAQLFNELQVYNLTML